MDTGLHTVKKKALKRFRVCPSLAAHSPLTRIGLCALYQRRLKLQGFAAMMYRSVAELLRVYISTIYRSLRPAGGGWQSPFQFNLSIAQTRGQVQLNATTYK